MTAGTRKNFGRAMEILEDIGLLLVSGLEIPDVCRLVGATNIRGSWWGHPLGPEIFAVSEMLSDHLDVTVTKLISGKVTLVHRSLWSKLVAVGKGCDAWQLTTLSTEAKLLLSELGKKGHVRTDELGSKPGKKASEPARELELRLLVHAEQFHSETGHHTKLLETWDHWANRVKLRNKSLDALRARNFLEKRVAEINDRYSGSGKLPWQEKQFLKVKRK